MATFHPFSRLPTELRDLIWEFSTEPRVVVIHVNREQAGEFSTSLVNCASPTPVPAVLQATRESRSFSTRRYTNAFCYGTSPRYIWTNFDIDTIQAECQPDEIWDFVVEAPLIRQLRVPVSDDGYCGYSSPFNAVYNLDVLLVSLESLTILVDGPFRDDWWGWLNVFEPLKQRVESGQGWKRLVEARIVDEEEEEISLKNYQAVMDESQ